MKLKFASALLIALATLSPAAALAGGPREGNAAQGQVVEPVPAGTQKGEGGEGPPPAGWYANEVTLFVGGSQVDAAPSGRDVRVRVSLRSDAEGPAEDTKVTLEASPQVRLIEGAAEVGTVQPGGVGTPVDFVLEVREEACAEFTGLLAKVSSSLGESAFEFGFPALCPGPRLYVEDVQWAGGDGDGVPEPGETLEVFVTLRNNGRDAASDVRGTLAINTGKVTILARATSWPAIPSGQAARNTEPVRVRIADDAERAQPCSGMAHGEPIVVDDEQAPPTEPTGRGSMTLIAPPDSPVSDGPETAPVQDEEDQRPPEDLPAIVDATLTVQAGGATFELGFGSMLVCALAAEDGGGPEASPAPSQPGGSAPIAAVLAATVAALLVRYRFSA